MANNYSGTKDKEKGVQYLDNFINPYTFVPIDTEVPERAAVESGDKSGVIECTLKVRSPLFIPNTTNFNAFNFQEKDHKSYEFYSYDDLSSVEKSEKPPEKPIVPGSEIRGMIRNVYEQLTNSCFLITDENNLPYKRTALPKKKHILKWNEKDSKWHLYDEKCGAEFGKWDFNNIKWKKDSNKYDVHGFLVHYTGNFDQKHIITSYNPKKCTGNGIKSFSETDDEFKSFINVIKSYIEIAEKNKNPYEQDYQYYLDCIKDKEPVLVYCDEQYKYLSPSCITKEFFLKKIPEILKEQNNHNACDKANKACPACRLFGMIGKHQKNEAIKSRVRFSDAQPEKFEFDSIRTLSILGSARISSTEFYMKKPTKDAKTWNYDYAILKYSPTKYLENYKPKLSGRKVYWHGKLNTEKNTPGNMNCSVRPLKSGEFKFKIFFDRLTEKELFDLIFCVTLNPENVNSTELSTEKGIHKIGKGKPIGMGDVEIEVNSVTLHSYESKDGKITAVDKEIPLSEIKADYDDPNYNKSNAIKNILAYTRPLSDEDAKIVKYPLGEDLKGNTAVYQWFTNNRGKSIQEPEINKTLPKLDDIENNKILQTTKKLGK
jgi:hypothetical protein